MAFERPTLEQLVERVQQDFVSRLGLAGAVLRRSLVYVLSRVLAGAVHMLYGRLEFLSKQLFPDQSETVYLERYAAIFGYSRAPATYAFGTVAVTGTIGSEIVGNETFLQRSDGLEYEAVGDYTLETENIEISVQSLVAGEVGNADEGVVLTFQSPLAGIEATTTVTADGLSGGTGTEGDASLRARLLTRLRNPPQGGAASDYILWALGVPGVTRAWVYPLELGAGTVVVRFVRDDDAGSIIPSGGEVSTVQAYINARRPVTADVTVEAPSAKAWNFTINLTPNTPTVRTAVQAELVDLFQREAEPGLTLPLSRLETAIGIATGVEDFTLVSPSSNLTHGAGELAVVGTFTWGP